MSETVRSSSVTSQTPSIDAGEPEGVRPAEALTGHAAEPAPDVSAEAGRAPTDEDLIAMGRDTSVFGRVKTAAGLAEAVAGRATMEIADARERLARAQRAGLGADEAAGRALALLSIAGREREALGGLIPDDGAPALDEVANHAERALADARASLTEVHAELRNEWMTGADFVRMRLS